MSCSPIKTLKIMNRRELKLQNCRGFTLLEALIGFLILSIGMLGIASLQAISLKSGKTSVYGSVAMMKVDELFESIRVNPSAVALTAYAVAGAGAGIDNACTGTKDCTGAELAQDDVFWWKQNLTAGLPDTASTAVLLTAAAAPSKMATVTITVNWSERNKDAAGSVARTYTSTANICSEIPC